MQAVCKLTTMQPFYTYFEHVVLNYIVIVVALYSRIPGKSKVPNHPIQVTVQRTALTTIPLRTHLQCTMITHMCV